MHLKLKHIFARQFKTSNYYGFIKKVQGFTIIELIIAIAVVGVLTAVAIPGYQRYIKSSRRTTAQAQLAQIINRAEQYYLQNNYSYPTNLSIAYNGSPPSSTYYSFCLSNSCTSAKSSACGVVCSCTNCVVATATATGGQASDTICATMVMDSTGNRFSFSSDTTSSTSTCWR